jgi:hypothetical protein
MPQRGWLVIRAIAIIANVAVIGYWSWSTAHEISVSQDGLGSFVTEKGLVYPLFVLPAIVSIAALAWIHHRVLRSAAVVASALSAVWWAALASAMSFLSVYQVFWSVFVLAPIIAIIAIVTGPVNRLSARRSPHGDAPRPSHLAM